MDNKTILLLINDIKYADQLKEKLINAFGVYISRAIQTLVHVEKNLQQKQVVAVIAEHKSSPNILIDIIKAATRKWPEIPFVVITENTQDLTYRQFMKSGAIECLQKNNDFSELVDTLKEIINLNGKNFINMKDWEIIGQSKPILKVKQEIAAYAQSDIPILIQGETGTGKELVARQLHIQSIRKNLEIDNQRTKRNHTSDFAEKGIKKQN